MSIKKYEYSERNVNISIESEEIMSGEYTIRALSQRKSEQQKTIVGRFPGKAPSLKSETDWTLQSETFQGTVSKWLLKNSTTEETYRGAPDGGLTGSKPSNYFILIKRKGDFVAVPVDGWVTFRQSTRRGDISLDDAEAAMKHRRLQAQKGDPVSAALVTAVEGKGALGDDEHDSDEEWKGVKASAALKLNVLKEKRHVKEEEEDMNVLMQSTALDFKDEYKPSDAEDWDHEIAADDDDLDMGDGSNEEEDVDLGGMKTKGRASPSISADEGDMSSDGEGLGDSSLRQRMKRVLRRTGLSSDSEGDVSDDEEDDDVDELDRMASAELPMSRPTVDREKASEDDGGLKKRKLSPTVSSEKGESAEEEEAQIKRPRSEIPVESTAQGIPTEQEIISLLSSKGRLQLSEIASVFRGRLRDAQERKQFTLRVKGVAKLDPNPDPSGKKYLILK
jgi:hypothetical protein